MDVKIETPSAVCSIGHTPLLISGLLVEQFRQHFANPKAIEQPEFRDRLWRATPDTGVMIEDWTVWKPEISGLRPAIIVRRNDWQSKKITFNNQTGTTPEGQPCYIRLLTGSHTLFCIAKEGAEAEILATEVYRYLISFGTVIAQAFDLKMFEHVHTGAPGSIREATDRYGVPVSVAYAVTESWVLRQHEPWLQRIQFDRE